MLGVFHDISFQIARTNHRDPGFDTQAVCHAGGIPENVRRKNRGAVSACEQGQGGRRAGGPREKVDKHPFSSGYTLVHEESDRPSLSEQS